MSYEFRPRASSCYFECSVQDCSFYTQLFILHQTVHSTPNCSFYIQPFILHPTVHSTSNCSFYIQLHHGNLPHREPYKYCLINDQSRQGQIMFNFMFRSYQTNQYYIYSTLLTENFGIEIIYIYVLRNRIRKRNFCSLPPAKCHGVRLHSFRITEKPAKIRRSPVNTNVPSHPRK